MGSDIKQHCVKLITHICLVPTVKMLESVVLLLCTSSARRSYLCTRAVCPSVGTPYWETFTLVWPCCIVTNFFVIKPTRCTNFTNLFSRETLHVSDSSSVHHQEFIHCTHSIGICHTTFEQDQDGTAVPSWSCSKAVY